MTFLQNNYFLFLLIPVLLQILLPLALFALATLGRSCQFLVRTTPSNNPVRPVASPTTANA